MAEANDLEINWKHIKHVWTCWAQTLQNIVVSLWLDFFIIFVEDVWFTELGPSILRVVVQRSTINLLAYIFPWTKQGVKIPKWSVWPWPDESDGNWRRAKKQPSRGIHRATRPESRSERGRLMRMPESQNSELVDIIHGWNMRQKKAQMMRHWCQRDRPAVFRELLQSCKGGGQAQR